MTEKVAGESFWSTLMKIGGNSSLRCAGIHCVQSILYNFFFLQYKAALLPGRIPISPVDHPLDAKIPFTPRQVACYLDFIPFWVRTLGFLLRSYPRKGIRAAEEFIRSMARIYTFAAEVYTKNLSTTHRPRYFAHPRFILIHGMDPHLMCIPSLHVMVVVRTYTKFKDLLRGLGELDRFAPQIEELKQGALRITEAVLYVKQHSINCVAASLYAMTRFDPPLFPPQEAQDFISQLFIHADNPDTEDRLRIGNYIGELYARFLQEGTDSWEKPLLAFLHARIPVK